MFQTPPAPARLNSITNGTLASSNPYLVRLAATRAAVRRRAAGLVRLQIEVARGQELTVDEDGEYETPESAERPHAGALVGALAGTPAAPGFATRTAVQSGSIISHHYDPMPAKVIGFADTRAQAAARLARALAGMRLHGLKTTATSSSRSYGTPTSWPGGPAPTSSRCTPRSTTRRTR